MRKIGSAVSKKRVLLVFLAAIILAFVIHQYYFLNKKNNKILLIGLDGATWKVMMPLINEGKLPNIKHLLEGGCWGRLGTLKNPVSEIIWTTIITGKSPELHGIIGNLMADPYTKELIPPTSNLRKVKAIWNILSERNKKIGVVGYRVNWPAEKVNGFMITERLNRESYFSTQYAYPPLNTFCTREAFNDFRSNSFIPQLRKDTAWVFDHDSFMANAAEYLYKNNKFDFFCLYLVGIDGVSHYYWKYLFPDNQDVSPEEISRYKDVIPSYYIWCDSVIGRLLRIADKNTTVIIISDHGFMTKDPRERKYNFSEVDALLEAAGLKRFSYNFKEVELVNATKKMQWEVKKNVRIAGNISENDFNAVKEKAKKALADIKVKENGNCLFQILDDTLNGFVFEMDRVCAEHAAERHILISGKEYKLLDFMSQEADSGKHDENDAVIIMSGRNMRHHAMVKGSSIYDIAPTVLYLLDLPVAKDMQGNVLTGAIDPKFMEKSPARYIDTYENKKPERAPKPIRSPEDEEIMKERMRSLGYIN